MERKLLPLLRDSNLTLIIGAFDPLSARLVQEAGYSAVWGSGFCVSARYGLPDANIIGPDTMIQEYCKMAEAVEIPILADCDTGYGDFHNVIHTVKQLEFHDVAGFCIEDKKFPKLNSFIKSKNNSLDSIEAFTSKIKAAVDSRKNEEFCVIARTEALNNNEPIDRIVQRLDEYKLAGADALLIHCNKNTTDELFHLIRLWGNQIPIILVPTTFPHVEFSEFQSYGISNIIVANQLLRASIFYMKSYLRNLSCAKNIEESSKDISTLSDVFELQNMQEYETTDTLYRQPQV